MLSVYFNANLFSRVSYLNTFENVTLRAGSNIVAKTLPILSSFLNTQFVKPVMTREIPVIIEGWKEIILKTNPEVSASTHHCCFLEIFAFAHRNKHA